MIATELRAGGGEVFATAADLGESDECNELVDWALHQLGGLDILVNNCGDRRPAPSSPWTKQPGATLTRS